MNPEQQSVLVRGIQQMLRPVRDLSADEGGGFFDRVSSGVSSVFGLGRSMSHEELMAQKEVLTLRINTLRNIFDKASKGLDRYSRSEIKMVTVIDVKSLGKLVNDYSSQLRKLDIEIQALNFTTELI